MALAKVLFQVCALFVAAHTEECYLPLDVMFVQDTTGSFTEDLVNVVNQIPDMLADISATHPYSRFGVAEFHDKPFDPLGEEGDFCYLLGLSLSEDADHFRTAYSKLGAFGGRDGPEASYHALINALEDTAVGWRPLAADKTKPFDSAYAGARVVILSTDAVPHLPNDYLKYNPAEYPAIPSYLPPYSGSPYPLQNDDIDWQCTAQDYPSPDQVRAIYLKHSAYLVILTPEDPEIVSAWQWVNRDLFKQPDGFYQFIEADSSNLLESVLRALDVVTATACATTTIAPATTSTPSSDLTRKVEDGVDVITFPITKTAPSFTSLPTTLPTLPKDTTIASASSHLAVSTTTGGLTAPNSLPTARPAADDTSPTTPASTGSMTGGSATTLTAGTVTEDVMSTEEDCCPHVEIKLMKPPKQWKVMVVN